MADFDDIDDFNDHAVQGKPIRAYKNGHFENPKVLFVQHHWTWDEFLCAASQRLEMVPTASRVFNADGAEIDDIMCIEENDMLFFSTGRSFKAPSSGKEDAATNGTGTDDKVASVVGGYKVTTLLGRGGFGEVRLGVHQLTNDRVALKFILKSEMGSLGDVERTTTEIQCLTALNHPSIIKLLRVINEPNHIVLVFELLEGGDLFHYLKNVPSGGLAEDEGASLFTQILAGVGYAHNQHICHRDLKLENILLTHKNDLSTVKIADFGLSDFYKPGAMMKTSCGSISYLAPEVFRGTSNAGPPLDVWSLGVILFAIVCGRLPFEGSDLHGTNRPRENVIRNRIMRGQYKLDEHFSPALSDLITLMLKPDPNERATIPEIFSHPWVRGAAGPSGLLSDLMLLNSRSGTQEGAGDGGDDDLDFAITYTPSRAAGGGPGGGALPIPAFLPVQANDDDKLPSILQRSPSRVDQSAIGSAGVSTAITGGVQPGGVLSGTPTTGRARGGRIVDNLLQTKVMAAPKLSPRPSGAATTPAAMSGALVSAPSAKSSSGGSLSPNTSNFKRNTSSTGASRGRTRPSAVMGFGATSGSSSGISGDKSHAERAPAHANESPDKLPLTHQKNSRRRSDQQDESADSHHLASTTAAATAVFHPTNKIPGGAQTPHLESIGRKGNAHQQEAV